MFSSVTCTLIIVDMSHGRILVSVVLSCQPDHNPRTVEQNSFPVAGYIGVGKGARKGSDEAGALVRERGAKQWSGGYPFDNVKS